MKNLFRFTSSLILSFSLSVSAASSSPRLIGYYGYWGPKIDSPVSEIPAKQLTHLIYSFIVISGQGECVVNSEDMKDGKPLVFGQIKQTKQTNPKLITLFSIGGGDSSEGFSSVVLTEKSRRKFVRSCVRLLQTYDFDGIDLDWEHPQSKSEWSNFVLLVRQFRQSLDRSKPKHFLLSFASAGRGEFLPSVAPENTVQELGRYLDWIGVMAYDYHYQKSLYTNHHARLKPSVVDPSPDPAVRFFSNGEAGINFFLGYGLRPDQVVLGVPFYGHAWSGVDNINHGLYQKHSVSTGQSFEIPTYHRIVSEWLPRFERFWDAEAKAPWLYNSKTRVMLSYEDPESLKAKAQYVLAKRLGGCLVWEISQDDSKHTLLNTLWKELGN